MRTVPPFLLQLRSDIDWLDSRFGWSLDDEEGSAYAELRKCPFVEQIAKMRNTGWAGGVMELVEQLQVRQNQVEGNEAIGETDTERDRQKSMADDDGDIVCAEAMSVVLRVRVSINQSIKRRNAYTRPRAFILNLHSMSPIHNSERGILEKDKSSMKVSMCQVLFLQSSTIQTLVWGMCSCLISRSDSLIPRALESFVAFSCPTFVSPHARESWATS